MGRRPPRARRGDGKVYKRGKLWAVRWTENGERRYSGGYLTEDAANRVRATIALNMQAGRAGLESYLPKKEPLPTFGSLVDSWLEDRRAKGRRSVDDDERRWKRHPLCANVSETARPLEFSVEGEQGIHD